MSDMWTAPEDDPRTFGNPVGEKETYRDARHSGHAACCASASTGALANDRPVDG